MGILPVEGLAWLRPAWLLAFVPLGWLLWRLAQRSPQGVWHEVVDAHLLPHVLVEGRAALWWVHPALLGLGLSVAILALAGPAVPGPTQLAYRDAARMLVVDLSAEMGDDTSPRLERARIKLLELLRTAPPGHSGLLVYAAEPYLAAPPTTDHGTLAGLVPQLSPGIMPLPGNRPLPALRMGIDLLARSGATQRDLLWVVASPRKSDLLAALAEAGSRGVRLSILQADGGVDGELAKRVEAAGGNLLPMRADDHDVRALAQWFESGPGGLQTRRAGAVAMIDLGPWLLLGLLPLALLAFRRGALLAVGVMMLQAPTADALDWHHLWQRPDQRAWQLLARGSSAAEGLATPALDPRWQAASLYRAGRHAEAAALLAPLPDADSHYNRGNALARLGRLPEALEAYQQALRLKPHDADMRHNHALVRQLLLQKPPEPAPGREPADPQGNRSQGELRPIPQATAPAAVARSPQGPTPSPAAPGDPLQDETGRLAEQWLRRLPADQAGLLQRKLMLEHERRHGIQRVNR